MDEIILKTRQYVSKKLGDDPLHGFSKIIRIQKNAETLIKKIGGNTEMINLSILLHNIAFNGKNNATYATESAKNAEAYLKDIGCPYEVRAPVVKIIVLHDKNNWKDKHKPKTIEEKIVYDAITAENISVLGILEYIMIKKHMKQENADIIKSLQQYITDNHRSLIFDHTKNMIEFDYRLISEFAETAQKQMDVS